MRFVSQCSPNCGNLGGGFIVTDEDKRVRIQISFVCLTTQMSRPQIEEFGRQLKWLVDECGIDLPHGFELIAAAPASCEGGNVWRLRADHDRALTALKSVSSQCGHVLFNRRQRPGNEPSDLTTWGEVKAFVDGALRELGQEPPRG